MYIQKCGITYHNRDKSTQGLTLYARNAGKQVWLINMEGDVVHEWQTTGGTTNFNYLRENGNLFICEKVDEGPGVVSGKSGRMREYDWDGNVVWEHLDDHQHHDARRLENGNAVYIAWKELTPAQSKKVKGGIPDTELDGKIYCDVIREVDEKGDIVWEFSNDYNEFFDKYYINPLAPREEYGHANTIFPMADGNYLISYRVFDLLVIVDRKTGKLIWEYQNHSLGGQHDCQELENGNILVFANGHNTPANSNPGPNFSQVWEIDPKTDEIVWKYFSKRNPLNFWSPHISGCQRLKSGNTLICEGGKGRIFEVTPSGEIVWEYINPFFGPHPAYTDSEINWVFRAKRYSSDSPQIQNRV